MSISCGVMKDLLPLYQERLLGPESVALVEEHLAGCPNCSKALEALRTAYAPLPAAQVPLKKVAARLKRDRWRRIGIAVTVMVFLGTVLFYHSTARQYLHYSPDIVGVKEVSPGKIVVEGSGVTGVWSQTDVPTQEDLDTRRSTGTTVYLSFFRSPGTPDDSVTTFTTTFEEIGRLRVYYAYPGELAVPIYGAVTSDSEGIMLLPRLALNYYWRLALVVAAVLGILYLAFRKWPGTRRWLGGLLCLPLCYVLAHFSIKGMDGTSWEMLRDLLFILVAWAAASAAVLLTLRQREARL